MLIPGIPLPEKSQNECVLSEYYGTTTILLDLIESGAAHQFVDGKVIQGDFVKSCTTFRKLPLHIHTYIREFFVKKHTQGWGTSPYCP